MINIVFPPGCYGTYLARCLYTYTNLRQEPFAQFGFDDSGSSHDHRYNKESSNYVQFGHVDSFTPAPGARIITLLPDDNHNLDYYNNQFYKQEKGQLISYIKSNYTDEEIFSKLKNNWGFNRSLDDHIPTWILREWCSFWIGDCWANGYSRERYSAVSDLAIEVQELYDSFSTVFIWLISNLQLTLTVDSFIINQTHNNFQRNQKFHNSQIKCNNWINCVINDQLHVIDQWTLFDEAYIQKTLRDKGYEIYCDGVNALPLVSTEMKELIYQI